MAGAFINGKFYVSHGFDPSGDGVLASVYDPLSDSWAALPSAKIARSELVGAAVNGWLYAIGGRATVANPFCPSPNFVCRAVEVYDPASGVWGFGASMPTARAGAGAAVLSGEIYVIGGRTGATSGTGTPLNTVEIFNPVANTWRTGPSLLTARMDVYATTVLDGRIYVFGGYNNGVLQSVEVFDPATNAWSFAPSMPTPRANAVAGVCKGHAYVIGGTNNAFQNLNVVEEFDPATGSWNSVTPLPTAGSEFAAGGVSGSGIIMATGSGIFGQAAARNFALTCEQIKDAVARYRAGLATGVSTVTGCFALILGQELCPVGGVVLCEPILDLVGVHVDSGGGGGGCTRLLVKNGDTVSVTVGDDLSVFTSFAVCVDGNNDDVCRPEPAFSAGDSLVFNVCGETNNVSFIHAGDAGYVTVFLMNERTPSGATCAATEGTLQALVGPVVPITECNDGIDNDGDGQIDWLGGFGDPDCTDPFDNTERPPPRPIRTH